MYGRVPENKFATADVNSHAREAAPESDQEQEYTDPYYIIYQVIAIAGNNMQEQLESVKQRYGFDEERATNFIRLKYAMKEELDYKGKNQKKLIEVSDHFTKDRVINAGKKCGLTESQVLELLPAIAMKLAQHELKTRQQFFARSQQYDEARVEIDGKYQRRFGL